MPAERWLVTGAAGFIGSAVARRLAAGGREVVGIDNCNTYYDPALKQARVQLLEEQERASFVRLDLRDHEALEQLLADVRPTVVIHLAAQAGVRHALTAPRDYVDSNLVGFVNVLEGCRSSGVRHLVYASSSSVYGVNSPLPFSVRDPADHPISLYAATKRANELMAHSYSHLFALPTTGLRFFTVYGPWGRPDMAYYRFADAILDGRPITVNGDGTALRDFTYIDDIVEGVIRSAELPPGGLPVSSGPADPSSSWAPWRVCNIGHGQQATVNHLIELLEDLLGRPAIRTAGPEQPGDVPVTHADVADFEALVGFRPSVSLEEGMARFAKWLLEHRR